MADAHWHDGLTRRLRSLLKTQPLHDLRANEGRRASVLPHDDTLALAMRAMEVMVDALGLRAGAPRQELTDALMPLLRFNDSFHNVATDEKRHHAVIAAVLGALLNDGDRRQAYRAEYLEFPNNVPVRRAISYRLAAECEAPDGEIVLRAESDGINCSCVRSTSTWRTRRQQRKPSFDHSWTVVDGTWRPKAPVKRRFDPCNSSARWTNSWRVPVETLQTWIGMRKCRA